MIIILQTTSFLYLEPVASMDYDTEGVHTPTEICFVIFIIILRYS